MSVDVYAHLEQRVAAWALTQPSIEAVIVVGSRARADHPADDWSDLDLIVFTSNATPYLNDPAWLSTFGDVIAAVSGSFGQRDREWIAVYADGSKIDAAFLSIDLATAPTLQAMLDAFPYPTVLHRGVRALVDRTGASLELSLPRIDAPQPPTQTEFTTRIHQMWLDTIKAAKFIRRNDLWRAKQVCDGDLKQHLLALLEWQAAAQKVQRDIWYDGRFLSEWADPQALADLPATFATYDTADLRRALFSTLDMFRRLAKELAALLNVDYSVEADLVVDQYLGNILPRGGDQ